MNTLILETSPDGQDNYIDIYQKMADSRILFISDAISTKLATDISANLFLKDQQSQDKITLILNASHGNLRDVFSIYDTMNLISSPIETVCVGQLCSAVVLLLSAGTKGLRKISQNSTLQIENLSMPAFGGDLNEIKYFHSQFKYDVKKYTETLGKLTGKTYKNMESFLSDKKYLSATEAKKENFVDVIIK